MINLRLTIGSVQFLFEGMAQVCYHFVNETCLNVTSLWWPSRLIHSYTHLLTLYAIFVMYPLLRSLIIHIIKRMEINSDALIISLLVVLTYYKCSSICVMFKDVGTNTLETQFMGFQGTDCFHPI